MRRARVSSSPSFLIALVALAVLAWPRSAAAFPQWQFSSGVSRCDQCHYAPAGGGLITNYGRDAVSDDLSMFGGNGALLNGLVEPLPSWLSLGGDLRGAFVAQDVDDIKGPTYAVFPMQADAEGRVAWDMISLYGVLGLRGQVRDDSTAIPTQNYQPVTASRLLSREHYLTIRTGAIGGYIRVGRFFPPFGLRMAEHILYVRRDLGFGTMEESYNLSTGYVFENSELHLTAFVPDFIRHMGSRESGFTAYYERRFADTASAAAQVRVASGGGMTRRIAGLVGKAWIAPLKTMLLAEADFARRDVDTIPPPSYQFVGVGGVSVLPIKGVMATVLQERNQVDLSVSGASYNATTGLLSWFPYAHFELQVMGRLQFPSGGQSVQTFFVQLHYFL
jgi:hypothetical protein